MRTRAAAVAVAVLAVVAATAGCSERPGVVAVVDGHEITQDELNETVDQLSPFIGKADGSPLDPRAVLTVMLLSPATVDVGAEHGLTVTDDAARARLDSMAEENDVDLGPLHPGSLAVGRYLVAMTASQEAPDAEALTTDLMAAWSALDPEINPRYGTWSPGSGIVDGDAPDWIVPTDASAAPTAE